MSLSIENKDPKRFYVAALIDIVAWLCM